MIAKFGIDEIYIHDGLSSNLLEKLHQRAAFSLDAEDNIIQKHVSHDMVFIFHKKVPSPSMIYRFLESLDQDADKENFIKSNILLNEEEFFLAVKSAQFVLVTHRTLIKEIYTPL